MTIALLYGEVVACWRHGCCRADKVHVVAIVGARAGAHSRAAGESSRVCGVLAAPRTGVEDDAAGPPLARLGTGCSGCSCRAVAALVRNSR